MPRRRINGTVVWASQAVLAETTDLVHTARIVSDLLRTKVLPRVLDPRAWAAKIVVDACGTQRRAAAHLASNRAEHDPRPAARTRRSGDRRMTTSDVHAGQAVPTVEEPTALAAIERLRRRLLIVMDKTDPVVPRHSPGRRPS